MYAHRVVTLIIFILLNITYAQSIPKYWQSVFKVNKLTKANWGSLIERPVGGTIEVAELYFYDSNFEVSKDCLFVKVPGNKFSGTLSIVNASVNEKCSHLKFNKNKRELLNGFYNISLSYRNEIFSVKYDTHTENIYFPNLDKRNKGLKFSSLKYEKVKNSSLKGKVCFQLDSQCKEIVNNCDMCPTSITPVFASNCPQPLKKYCSISTCGKVGGHACVRGRKSSGFTGDYCINDSPVAYCTPPARVVCINQELVCR